MTPSSEYTFSLSSSLSLQDISPPQGKRGETHKQPIRQNRQRRHGIRRRHNFGRRHAAPPGDPIVPLLVDGAALEDVPEEDGEAPDGDDEDADAEDPGVHLLGGGEAEEEDADAELDEAHEDDVCSDG